MQCSELIQRHAIPDVGRDEIVHQYCTLQYLTTCMHVCMHGRTHTRMRTHTHTHTHTHISIITNQPLTGHVLYHGYTPASATEASAMPDHVCEALALCDKTLATTENILSVLKLDSHVV